MTKFLNLRRLLEYGARNNRTDKQTIQEMHDMACQLGAECNHENAPGMLKDGGYMEAVNLDEQTRMVRDAWVAKFGNTISSNEIPSRWPRDVFDTFLVVETSSGLMAYPYMRDNKGIVFGEPYRVEIDYRKIESNTTEAGMAWHNASAKGKRCVADVMKQGKDQSAAIAICRASLGEAFEMSPLEKQVREQVLEALKKRKAAKC